MSSTELGKRLKMIRIENKLTQEEFGKPYNLKKSTISQYESGASRPDDELKKQIALDYNVSLDYLMGISNIKESADKLINNSDKTIKKSDDKIDTIAAHLEGKDITPHKMKMIKRYIDDLFEDFDD